MNDGRMNDESEVGAWAAGFVVREEAETPRRCDLEERTARFGEAVIDFLKKVPEGPRTNRLIDQLTGCGTSVGGNYCEADDAVSKKEFVKIKPTNSISSSQKSAAPPPKT